MKKYLLSFLSIFTLLILLVIGFRDLISIETILRSDSAEIINGTFAESFRKDFDMGVPVREKAISLWSFVKFSLFKEGSKGVLTGPENWLFTDEEYNETLNDKMNREEFFYKIEEVNQYFNEKQISLLIVLIPSKSRIYQDKITRFPYSEELLSRYNQSLKRLADAGISTVDLSKEFFAQKDLHQIFYKYDTHWTFEGATIASEVIQKQIEPFIKSNRLSKRSFFLRAEDGENSFEGDLLDYVLPMKGLTETYKKITAIDADPPKVGLFDSVEIPVILVGTSYSFDPRWNFEDALKLSLQLDVLNLSAEGEGPFPPMADLMESEYFYEVNSKIVIWEIPERYISLY